MKIVKKSALVVGALILSLGVCEVLVRMLIPVRNVGPSFTIYDPYYGKRLKPNFSTTRVTPEFTMQISINSLGFRGPEPFPTDESPVLFLGDSFTMGYGVNDGEEFPALIRASLKNRLSGDPISVINAGLGSNGNGRWVKLLRMEGPKYNPSFVVMQICSNDEMDNRQEHLFEYTADGGLNELPVPPPGWKRRFQSWIETVPGLSHSYIVGLLRQVRFAPRRNDAVVGVSSNPGKFISPSEEIRITDSQRLTARLIEESITICRRYGWPILAVLADLNNPQRGFYISLFETHNIPVITIPSKQERPDLYYEVDGHWRPSGHIYAAEKILEALDGQEDF